MMAAYDENVLIDKKKVEKKFAQKLAQMKKVNLRKHLIFVMFGVECVYDNVREKKVETVGIPQTLPAIYLGYFLTRGFELMEIA